MRNVDRVRSALAATGSNRRGWTLWSNVVPVVCLAAGLLFAISARDSRGTELRSSGVTSLADTVGQTEARVRRADAEVRDLQRQVDAEERAAGRNDSAVARAQAAAAPLLAPGGLTAVHGPGLTVVLDDAHDTGDAPDAQVANQEVVHQSDLQAVVNALWAGGAEAMTIAGQRVVATSAVRCVGNTLLLNGEVYSPPYRVAAIGPADDLQQRLDDSAGVGVFRTAAAYYGLGYTVETDDDLRLPAYANPISLIYARPGSR